MSSRSIIGYTAAGIFATAGLATVSVPAAARDSAVYAGGGVGYYRIDGEDFLTEDDDLKDNRSGIKAFVGTNINDVFGLEAAYVDFRDSADGPITLEAEGYTVGATVGVPLDDSVRLYGKIGQLFWDSTASLGDLSASRDGDDPFVGVGVRFGESPGVGVKVEYERYELDDTTVDMPSVNLNVAF